MIRPVLIASTLGLVVSLAPQAHAAEPEAAPPGEAPAAAPPPAPAAPAPTDKSQGEPAPPSKDEPPAPVLSRAQMGRQIQKLTDLVAAQKAALDAQWARLDALEKQAHPTAPNGAGAPPAEAPQTAPSAASNGPKGPADPRDGLVISGYIQGQYEHHQQSEDQVKQGGTLLNLNRTLIRRARVVTEHEWKYAAMLLELDANTVNGPAFGVQRGEATLLYRGDNPISMPPLASLTFGVFRTPFSNENLQSPKDRYFMERSTVSQASFPSEVDAGVRLAGAIGWLRYQVGIMNGEPLGVKEYALQSPLGAKDLALRLGAEFQVPNHLQAAFGISILKGQGFHHEADAVKSTVQWNDSVPNGSFDGTSELKVAPAVGAKASSSFDRSAVAADLDVRVHSPLGWSEIFEEAYAGTNMDRGLFYADPTLTNQDIRHVGYMVGVLQEVTPWITAGLRMDYYNPNSDLFEHEGGNLVPLDQAMRTFSPLVSVNFESRARLLFQYDFIRDKLGRTASGLPTDLRNDAWTLRVQVVQ